MLVEIRKNVFIESTQVRTVFFSADAGQVFIQLDAGQHAFKLLEGEDPDVVVPRFVEMIHAANKPARPSRAKRGVELTQSITGTPAFPLDNSR